jgi:hypothetical protein
MSLTMKQRRFLSARALALTDEAACEIAGIPSATFNRWCDQTEFRVAYDEALADVVAATRQYTYALLDHASEVLERMLDAEKTTKDGDEVPDWEARGKAIDLLYTSAGIKNNKLELTGNVGVQVINDAIPRPAQDQ